MRLTGNDLLAVWHLGAAVDRSMRFTGVSTDTRTVKKGEIFVAVRGDRFDGNKFVAQAFRKGAAAAVVDSPAGMKAAAGKPHMRVEDSVAALGELARIHRSKFTGPVIAVAGSNGKTTTKEMIADVLSKKYSVVRSKGSFNNHIGVPMTLFGLRKGHSAAVVEIGTNHFGEVKTLCKIAMPTHGLITNVGREHLEFFGSPEGAAKEEAELFVHLKKHRGRAYVNADDSRIVRRSAGLKGLRYGFGGKAATVKGEIAGISADGRCELVVRTGRGPVVRARLRSPGREMAANALAAATVGLDLGVPATAIGAALSRFKAVGKRMEIVKAGGVTIINDAYNANPDSMTTAASTLTMVGGNGKRIAVLGDMLELGKSSASEHKRVGRKLKSMGLDAVYTFGKHARYFRGAHFATKRALVAALLPTLERGDAVLVKGSRGMKMEEVVDAIMKARKNWRAA